MMSNHCPNLVAIGRTERLLRHIRFRYPRGYRFVRPVRNGLNRSAVPSKFSWTPVKDEEEEDVERTAVSKLERSRIEQNEATDTASEGAGDGLRVSGLALTSQKTQTYEDDLNVQHLRKKKKMFSYFTGFDSYAGFMDMLKFISA